MGRARYEARHRAPRRARRPAGVEQNGVAQRAVAQDGAEQRNQPVGLADPASGGSARHRRFGRIAAFSALSNVVLPLTSLVSGPILAHVLGPTQRGQLAAATAPAFVLMFLANMGLPEAATYAVAKLRQDPRRVMGHVALLSMPLGILTAACMWIVAPAFLDNDPTVVPLLRGIMLALPFLMLVISLRFALNGMRQFGSVNAERVLTPLLRLSGFIVLAFMGSLTVESAAVSQVGATLASGVFLLVALLRRRARAAAYTTYDHDPALTRKLAAYGFRGWGAVLGNLVNWRLDQLVLVALVAPEQLGFYVVAVHFAEIPAAMVNALRNALFAESAHRGSGQLVARTARVVVFFVTVGAVAASLASPLVIRILFGEPFLPAVPMAVVLLIASIPFCLEQVLAAGLLAHGKPGRRSISQIIAAALTVVGLILLTPRMGAMGAAVTSLVAYSVNAALAVFQFRRTSGLPARQLLVLTAGDIAWLKLRVTALRHRRSRSRASEEAAAESSVTESETV